MKRWLLALALLASPISAASASGIGVNWGLDCWGENPYAMLTWLCASNSYASTRPGAAGTDLIGITVSYVMPYDKTNVVATDVYMEGVPDGGNPVPDWWRMGEGECRGAPSVVNVVTLTGVYAGGGGCNDYWQGGGGGGLGLYSDETYRMHVNGTWAVSDPVGTLGPASGETYAVTYKIKTAKTAGTGACAGCLVPVCWAVNYIQIAFQGEQESLLLGNPFEGGNQFLGWNGGVCRVPARPTTWGRVKSLYR